MERAALQGQRSHHYLRVQTRSLHSQSAAAVSNCSASLKPASAEAHLSLSPHRTLKETLIKSSMLAMLCTPGKDKVLLHQAKDHPSPEGLSPHTLVQM